MDVLLKQLRGKSSGIEPQRRETPQKTVSFKREENKSWFQRQFTDQMDDADESDSKFAAAVAAAAFSVVTQEEEPSLNQANSSKGSGGSLTKAKSRKEEGGLKPRDSSNITRWLSGKNAKEDGKPLGEISMRKPSMRDQRFAEGSVNDTKKPEKVPSIKMTPTFSGKYPNDTGSKSFKSANEKKAGPSASMSMKPTGDARWEENKNQAGKVESKADTWEKAQMEKIRIRYEKVNTTITEWENEHNFKAKTRFNRKERASEKRKAITIQEYRNELAKIDNITREARTLAVEKKRKDEAKTIATAKEMRSTGRIPHTCFCF